MKMGTEGGYGVLDEEGRGRLPGFPSGGEDWEREAWLSGGERILAAPAGMRLSTRAAESWLARTRWPEGCRCPGCGGCDLSEYSSRAAMAYRCRICRRTFSVRSGTAMENSKVASRCWVGAFQLYFQHPGVGRGEWQRMLGVGPMQAEQMWDRIRAAVREGGDGLVCGVGTLLRGEMAGGLLRQGS